MARTEVLLRPPGDNKRASRKGAEFAKKAQRPDQKNLSVRFVDVGELQWMGFASWLRRIQARILYFIYDFLGRGQTPEKADCIFVFAGRPERKVYGLQLFRQGYAKRIVLSVGRFEWRGFPGLGLANDGGLVEMVQKTPPEMRHFFVIVDDAGVRCQLVPKGKLGTMSEILALADFVRQNDVRQLMVVSSSYHLRRVCATLRSCFPSRRLKLNPVAVPEDMAAERRSKWWAYPRLSSVIRKEYLKLIVYKAVLPCYVIMQRPRRFSYLAQK